MGEPNDDRLTEYRLMLGAGIFSVSFGLYLFIRTLVHFVSFWRQRA